MAFVDVCGYIRFTDGEYIEWYTGVHDLNGKTLCIGKLAGNLYVTIKTAILIGIFKDVDEDFLQRQLYLADPLIAESLFSGAGRNEVHEIIEGV